MSENYSQKTGSYLPDVHRVLPYSEDAEKALVSCVLISPNEVFDEAVTIGIRPSVFHVPAIVVIWEVLSKMVEEKYAIDFITLTKRLKAIKKLDDVGGPFFVTNLFTFTPSASNWKYYADIILEKWELRECIKFGNEIVARCYDDIDDLPQIRQFAQSTLLEISKGTEKKARAKTMFENVIAAQDRIQDIKYGKVKSGLPTGIKALDRKLGGLHDGEVIVLSGTTGGGKTSLAHNIAVNIGVQERKGVLIFSFEMNALWVTNRMIASMARINTELIRNGEIDNEDAYKFSTEGQILASAPIFIEDDPDMSLDVVRTRSRRRKSTDDIQLILIDYLQKIPYTGGKKNSSRQRDVAEISDGIQKMAMELNVPVVVLSQENDDGEVREARDIAFDAKTVLKIRRDEYDGIEKEGLIAKREIVIRKNNNGPIGIVPVTFEKQFVKFVDYYDPNKLQEREERESQRNFIEPSEND